MSRRLRIIVASVLLAVAVLGTVVVATQIETTYFLPPGPTGMATRETELFVPAIVATVVGLLVIVGTAVHLVVAVKRRPPRWMSVAATLLTLVVAGVPFVVGAMDRPVF